MAVHVSGAVLGACLLVIPPVIGPGAEQRVAEPSSVGYSIDLASSSDTVLTDPGGDTASLLAPLIEALTFDNATGSGALGDELADAGSLLSMVAEPAQADLLGDIGEQIANILTTVLVGGFFLFSGIVVSVLGAFQDAWDWLAGAFGFEPDPYGAEAVPIELPDLGDITALFSDPWV